MTSDLERAVAAHYGRPDLLAAILDGLAALGVDLDALCPEDLAPVDEFHTAGRRTTLEALGMTPIAPGMHVLDAGCGLGGASRVLARERGCRVTGVDLTPEYVEVARALSERMRLGDACAFHVGSLLDLPFPAAAFDAAVSFHAAMNIVDRGRLYAELARVLRTGASLCIFDVMRGPAAALRYPVPWAETEATSFLRSTEETCALLAEAGFTIQAQRSMRDFAIDYFRPARAGAADRPAPLGLHLLTGANSAEKFGNYVRALGEHAVDPTIVVALRA